jgi:uncharacterized membrane protein YbaN (DUF454 family)
MKQHIKRVVYIVIGILATVLAMVGVLTPGLPAVLFLLIALWAFAQSSQKMHEWLHKIPILRTALDQAHEFQEHRAVRMRAKIIAQLFAWGSFVLIFFISGPGDFVLRLVVFLAAVSCSVFMFLIPTLHKS